MAQITDKHKQELSNYFGEGIYEVKIENVQFNKMEDGREYADVTVLDPENAEKKDTIRFWFHTDGAINFSFNRLREIFVHNAPEGQKDQMKSTIDAISSTDELEKVCKTLKGKGAFLSIFKSPTRTYLAKDGTTKPNYDKNLYGYKPAAPTVKVGDTVIEGTEEDTANLPSGY